MATERRPTAQGEAPSSSCLFASPSPVQIEVQWCSGKPPLQKNPTEGVTERDDVCAEVQTKGTAHLLFCGARSPLPPVILAPLDEVRASARTKIQATICSGWGRLEVSTAQEAS